MLRVSIDFRLDDRFESVRAMLERLSPIFGLPRGAAWEVDVSQCDYMGPDAATVLYAAWLRAGTLGQQPAIRLPDGPPELDAFCHFIGLKHLLHGGEAPDMSHEACVTVPLRVIENARHGDADPIFRLVAAYTDVPEGFNDALGTSFTEVIQNVKDHSRSNTGAISAARYMKSSAEVRIAVVDVGDGVFETLRKVHPDTRNAEHALRRVLFGGFSARSRINNAGQGINNLRLCVGERKGSIFIVSGNGIARLVRGGTPTFGQISANFPGTGVFFTLPVHFPLG